MHIPADNVPALFTYDKLMDWIFEQDRTLTLREARTVIYQLPGDDQFPFLQELDAHGGFVTDETVAAIFPDVCD